MNTSFEDTTQLSPIPRLHRPDLLLVDDDQLGRSLLATFLRAERFPVVEVSSAEDALTALHEKFYQIIMTDIGMPGMGGLSLCRELRAKKLQSYVYIIAISGDDAQEGAVAALQAGADDYIRKGISGAELAARLQTAERIVTLEQHLRDMLDKQRRLAASDMLTGLPNRRAFSKHFNAEFKRSLRFGDELTVLLLDIDHFKAINDKYGHAAGDEVLKQFTAHLGAHLPRQFDFFARLGGEEFAVLLPQTDLNGGEAVAERLRQTIEEKPFQAAGHLIRITVSIGVSALSERTRVAEFTPEDLLDLADQRLYASKNSGRNRVTSAPLPIEE